MILVLNIRLIDQSFGLFYDRGMLKSSNKADVFRYMLASLSVIPFSHVFIQCVLSTEYEYAKEMIQNDVENLFSSYTLRWNRCEYQHQWQDFVEEIERYNDPIICFFCNHDQIFLDYNLDMIHEAEELLKKEESGRATTYLISWPELMVHAYRSDVAFHTINYPVKEGNFIKVRWNNPDSVQLITTKLFREWWFGHNNPGLLFRSDCTHAHVHFEPATCYIPLREMFRHFDGISHVGTNVTKCPALSIPEGFFERNIRIIYGSNVKAERQTSINPFSDSYCAYDINGTDAMYTKYDLPLFWRQYISNIDDKLSDKYTKQDIITVRNNKIMELATSHPLSNRNFPPKDWIMQLPEDIS